MTRNKKILFIDLKRREFDLKNLPDMNKYVGGFCLGLGILSHYQSEDPLVFCIGPLNGFFPFASKTAVIFNDKQLEDLYLGGNLSTRIRYSNLDALVFLNQANSKTYVEIEDHSVKFYDENVETENLGLPGRRSSIIKIDRDIVLDSYYKTPGPTLYEKFKQKNLMGFVLTASNNMELTDASRYKELFDLILSKTKEMETQKGFFPSCGLCPMGCESSKEGEKSGDILLHSLVACGYAKNVFSDINMVFSCINSLGFSYTHEDLEILPDLVKKTLESIK